MVRKKEIDYEKFISFCRELDGKHVVVGITKESNFDNRAQVLYDDITDFGKHALGRGDRDPLYQNTNINKDFLGKELISFIKKGDLDANKFYENIGKKCKDFIESDIRTKGHGTWRENADITKIRKIRDKNPLVRSHANDIFIANEGILRALSHSVR